MHVLILENNINIDNFVLNLKENNDIDFIFVSQDAICNIDDVIKLDIDSDEVSELLEFSLANEIGFVFAFSLKSQNTELKEVFELNGINVFASSQIQFEKLLSRSNIKKLIYKNKIPALKFAIFEKQNMATDWCKTADYPIIITTDMKDEIKESFYVDTQLKAVEIIENLFEKNYEKILIEQATFGHNFTCYYLTDSNTHIHLGNFYKDKKMTVCPDFQIFEDKQNIIFNDFYLKILNSLNYNCEPFSGIIKLDFIMQNNELFLNDVGATFNTTDFQILLNILDVNIFDLLSSLPTNCLEDFENCDLLKDNYIATIETNEENPLFKDDDNVELIKIRNNNFLYLAQASTVNRACEYLNEI